MTSEQIYFLTLGLLNLVVAFAGTRIEDLEGKPTSIHFLTISFFAFSLSWFLYSFEIGVFLQILSAVTALVFIWGIMAFSFRRCEKHVPWNIVLSGFLIHSSIQSYFTYKDTFNAVLHLSGIVIPFIFITVAYLFLKVKKKRNSSDTTLAYIFIITALILILRSVALETSELLFSVTKITSQAIWPAFSVAVGVFSFLSFTQEAQGKLKIESYTDSLTGIFNRRGFVDTLKTKTAEIAIENKKMVFVLFDLDHFKNINDKYGHDAGDMVLKKTVHQVKSQLRESDIFGRYGGEEFVILLSDVDVKNAQSIVERMRESIEKMHCLYEAQEISITASFGLIEMKEFDSFDKVFIEVDQALYDAKKDGRNNIKIKVRDIN